MARRRVRFINGPGPRLGPKGFTEGGRTAVWRTVGRRTALRRNFSIYEDGGGQDGGGDDGVRGRAGLKDCSRA